MAGAAAEAAVQEEVPTSYYEASYLKSFIMPLIFLIESPVGVLTEMDIVPIIR